MGRVYPLLWVVGFLALTVIVIGYAIPAIQRGHRRRVAQQRRKDELENWQQKASIDDLTAARQRLNRNIEAMHDEQDGSR